MGNKKFTIQGIIGNKIYRYVDSNGNKGNIHFSKSELTPSRLIFMPNGETYVRLDGSYFSVENMKELDAIDNALNNPKKSLKRILQTPSSFIAKTEPDLFKKVLFATRESIIFNTQPENSGKKHAISAYEELDIIAKKLDTITKKIEKINFELEKQKTQETIKEKL